MDAEDILSLQKLAYRSEAEIYDEYNIPPLTQTLDEIKNDFTSKVFLIAVTDGAIIGSVRAYEKDGTCHIERLIVHPEYQNRGIGSRLLNEIENVYNGCNRFELFTGYKSKKNIRLYEKHHYNAFRTEKVTDRLQFVFMEKQGCGSKTFQE